MALVHLHPNSSRLMVILHTIWSLISTQIHQLIDPNFVNICDKYPVHGITGFDAAKYVGTWYEQAHVVEFDFFQPKNSVCIKADYSQNKDGSIKVVNSYQDGDTNTINQNAGKRHAVTGVSECDTSKDHKAECKVSFFGVPQNVPNYVVLDTDYDTHSVVYACDAMTQIQTAWILSRKPMMDSQLLTKAKATLDKIVPNMQFQKHIDNGKTYQGKYCDYAQPKDDTQNEFLY